MTSPAFNIIVILWLNGMAVRGHLKLSNTLNGVYANVAQSDLLICFPVYKCSSAAIRTACTLFLREMTLSWVDEGVTWSPSRVPQQISPNLQTQNHNWQYSAVTSSPLRHITAQRIWAAYAWAKWKQTRHCWCWAAQEEAAVVVFLTLSRSHRLSGQNKWYAFR